MAISFNPQSDYLAPIGIFAERLLGADIGDAIAESVQTQALLVVMERHMIVPEELSADEAKKYKDDQLFKQVFKKPAALKSDIEDMVPAEHDLETEIEAAHALINAKQGVPNVPPFGMILSKKLPRDTVNQALQVQAGLRVLAITDEWEGRYNIVPPRLFDNDPAELNMVQGVLVNLHSNYLAPQKDGHIPSSQFIEALPLARDVAILAIAQAQDALGAAGYGDAVANLDLYQAQKPDVDYAAATQRYLHAVNQGPAQGPSLKPGL